MQVFAEALAVASGLALLVPVFRVQGLRKRLSALNNWLAKSLSKFDQEFGSLATQNLKNDIDEWNKADEFFLRLGLILFIASAILKLWIAYSA